MVYETGPIAPATLPLAPRIVTPGTFAQLGAGLAAFLSDSDAGHAAAVGTLAELSTRELGDAFNADVVPAIAGLDVLDQVADAIDVAGVVVAVDAATEDLGVLLLDLPGPDEGAESDPIDPGGDPPGGGQD